MNAEQWELVSEKSDGTRHYRHRRTRASAWTKPNCEVEAPGYGPITTAELTTLTGEPLPDPPDPEPAPEPDPDPEPEYWGDLPTAAPTESGGTFGWALEVMRRGERVRRKGWDGFHLEQLVTGPVRAILFIEDGKPDSVIVCNIGRDLLATDWEIAPPNKEGE